MNNEKEKIVFIDSSMASTALYKIAVESKFPEYEVLTYQSGVDALKDIEEYHGLVKMVATEVRLPIMTGAEVLKQLKQKYNIPAVGFITAQNREFIKEEHDFYKQLPIHHTELTDLVQIYAKK